MVSCTAVLFLIALMLGGVSSAQVRLPDMAVGKIVPTALRVAHGGLDRLAAAGVPPAANARPQVAQVSASVARPRRQQHASGFYSNMVVAPLAVLASCLQPGGCAPKELRDKMKTQT